MVWTLLIAVIVLGCVYGFYLLINERLKRMETRMDLLTGKIASLEKGVDVQEPEINRKLRGLMKNGETVKAVREARKALGLSLLEAKQYVDGL
ncbi:hypothetical protein [Planococcus shixiaomingii]|uniref:hypothetical protein n=1 Tax=Planococcus shixiaomingii TaxID=3058393 RepID=UPI002637AEAB|nr:hypothetical protein [Planococcus sp. N022]WKA53566.1 hypothetical protein QWY21_12950 [Planococcus sp. N022]